MKDLNLEMKNCLLNQKKLRKINKAGPWPPDNGVVIESPMLNIKPKIITAVPLNITLLLSQLLQ